MPLISNAWNACFNDLLNLEVNGFSDRFTASYQISRNCLKMLLRTFILGDEGFASVNTRKILLYRHCYIPSFLVQVFTIQSKNTLSNFLTKGFNVYNTRLRRASIALKPAPDIDVSDTITEQPFEITLRGLQRPLIHGCRCPFPL